MYVVAMQRRPSHWTEEWLNLIAIIKWSCSCHSYAVNNATVYRQNTPNERSGSLFTVPHARRNDTSTSSSSSVFPVQFWSRPLVLNSSSLFQQACIHFRVQKSWVRVALHQRVDLHLSVIEGVIRRVRHVLTDDLPYASIQADLNSTNQHQASLARDIHIQLFK